MSGEFTANTAWVHVLADMVRDPRWQALSPTATKVWMTLRGCADLGTGKIDLGQEELARRCGMSLPHVRRAVRELILAEFLDPERIGRRNRYVMRDRIRLYDEEGCHHSTATLNYVPIKMKKLLAEIRDAAGGQQTTNITINFVAGDQINIASENAINRRALIEALLQELGEREVRRLVKVKYGKPASQGDLFLAAELLVDERCYENEN